MKKISILFLVVALTGTGRIFAADAKGTYTVTFEILKTTLVHDLKSKKVTGSDVAISSVCKQTTDLSLATQTAILDPCSFEFEGKAAELRPSVRVRLPQKDEIKNTFSVELPNPSLYFSFGVGTMKDSKISLNHFSGIYLSGSDSLSAAAEAVVSELKVSEKGKVENEGLKLKVIFVRK